MPKRSKPAPERTPFTDAVGFYNPNLAKAIIRVGLIFVFLYASISAFREPATWIGYVPTFVSRHVNPKTVLDLVAIVQLVLVVGLMVGRYLKVTALVATVMLLAIVLSSWSSLVITFRDVGLACMALALVFLD